MKIEIKRDCSGVEWEEVRDILKFIKKQGFRRLKAGMGCFIHHMAMRARSFTV